MKRFPSVKKNTDFQKAYQQGVSAANAELVMYVRKNGLDYSRIGISCSKKIGNSIVRHTMARKLREIFRTNIQCIERGVDIILVVRKKASCSTYQQIEKAYLNLCNRHHIVVDLK